MSSVHIITPLSAAVLAPRGGLSFPLARRLPASAAFPGAASSADSGGLVGRGAITTHHASVGGNPRAHGGPRRGDGLPCRRQHRPQHGSPHARLLDGRQWSAIRWGRGAENRIASLLLVFALLDGRLRGPSALRGGGVHYSPERAFPEWCDKARTRIRLAMRSDPCPLWGCPSGLFSMPQRSILRSFG